MRRGSIIGLMLASSMAMVGGLMAPMALPEEPQRIERPIERKRRRDVEPSRVWWRQRFPHPSRIQKGTGAGGAGAHRRWKARRAAGIY